PVRRGGAGRLRSALRRGPAVRIEFQEPRDEQTPGPAVPQDELAVDQETVDGGRARLARPGTAGTTPGARPQAHEGGAPQRRARQVERSAAVVGGELLGPALPLPVRQRREVG